jgi:glycosyltransferase involved in cell wall biosynthesis
MSRLSVGLPVYNGERYIGEAVESILSQTFEDFELIISDNASTDQTQRICEEYARGDRRVRYYRNEVNLGAGKNYNRVFELSSGEYFKWASHDDVCVPEFFMKCVAVLDKDPSIVLCYPKMVDIDGEGRRLDDRNISHIPRSERGAYLKPHQRFRRLIRTDYTCEEVFGLIRSAVLGKTRLFLNYADSDRTLLAELGLYGRFYEVPDVLFYHRLHMGMSTRVFVDRLERAVWFDPATAGEVVFPRWRQFFEYLKSILRVPLRLRERVWCFMFMGDWVRERWLLLLRELMIGLNQASQSSSPIGTQRSLKGKAGSTEEHGQRLSES